MTATAAVPKRARQPAPKPAGWRPSIGDRVLYWGGPATVMSTGTLAHASGEVGRCYWLRSDVDRGSIRAGSEFRSRLAPLSPATA